MGPASLALMAAWLSVVARADEADAGRLGHDPDHRLFRNRPLECSATRDRTTPRSAAKTEISTGSIAVS